MTVYTDKTINSLELRWGKGFLSPGGNIAVKHMLDNIELDERTILDFGCGTGGPGYFIAQNYDVKYIVGVDIGLPAITRAKNYSIYENISYVLIGNTLPFKSNSIDVIFSKETIMHVLEKQNLYTEFLRILCPGGIITISDWYCKTPLSIEMENYISSANLTLNMNTIEETNQLLLTAGFKNISMCDRTIWYSSVIDMELSQAIGPNYCQLASLFGEKGAASYITRLKLKIKAVKQGDLRPGLIRANK